MADSIRERIFAAVETVMLAVDGIGQVSRGKIDPLAIQRYPAAFILPGADLVTEELNTLLTRDLQVFIFLWIRAQVDIHKVVEVVLPKVQQAMVADNTLGGLTIDVTETEVQQPFPLSEDQSEAGLVIDYAIKYRVRRDNPYAIS